MTRPDVRNPKDPTLRPTRFGLTTRRIVAPVVAGAILLGLGYCLAQRFVTELHIAFADDQTAIFEQMRTQAAESPSVDVGSLEYALNYYPSGTKQAKGSALDRVVERARQSAMREIIAILRARTGKDFGDDPRRWIDGLDPSTRRGESTP